MGLGIWPRLMLIFLLQFAQQSSLFRSETYKWKWKPSSSGRFWVKSAYTFVLEDASQLEDPIQAPTPNNFWKKLWKMQVPPRIIHFVWLCCYRALPFADSLARRGVVVDDSCPFCVFGPSSAVHLFFQCSFARDVWTRVVMLHHIDSAQHVDAANWFISVLGLRDFDADFFSILCYLIWYYRNRALFEGIETDDCIIYRSATQLLSDFRDAKGWPERAAATLGSRLWTKPPRNGLRVYFDGALSPLPAGGTGVFVADESGSFVYGTSKFYHGITNPHVIDMLALRDAFRLALGLGLSGFSVLGDSQTTVLAVLGEVNEPSLCSAVLDEVKSLLLNIDNSEIYWIRRSENFVAHDLAFRAKSTIDCNVSWSSIPTDLLSIRVG